MRKSSLILLLAVAFVLTTVASGFATVTDGPCQEPCKSWRNMLKIAEYQAPEGQETGPQCPLIDYEGADGYCSGNGASDYYNAQGILFKVCDCPDVEFDAATSYGIKIEILEPTSGGVYFADTNLSASDYDGLAAPYTLVTAPACTGDSTRGIVVTSYCDAAVGDAASCDNNSIDDLCTQTADATPYEMGYVALDGKNLYDATSTGECSPASFTNLASAIQTACYYPFMQKDLPYVLIDMPAMVWDPNVVKTGDKIVVRVTITGEGGTSVCPSCKDLCSCTVQVGVIGCDAAPASECYTCFPYFTSLDDAAWWSGFALTNSGHDEATVAMTFTAGGTSVPVTLTVPAQSVLVKALSELDLTALSGKGPIYAMAVSTVPSGEGTLAAQINGFAIMGDNTQAYGYLARDGQYCGCASCK